MSVTNPCLWRLQNNNLPRVPTALGHLPNLKEWNLRANCLPHKYEQARRVDALAWGVDG